jgi:hypothetical protein
MAEFERFLMILRLFYDEMNFNGISSSVNPVMVHDGSAAKVNLKVEKSMLDKTQEVLENVIDRIYVDFKDDIEEIKEEKCHKAGDSDFAEMNYIFKFKV